MSTWVEIPDEWSPLPAALARQPNVKVMIAAGLVETRERDDVVEWRRKPANKPAGGTP
jgi:hypothetical protein